MTIPLSEIRQLNVQCYGNPALLLLLLLLLYLSLFWYEYTVQAYKSPGR